MSQSTCTNLNADEGNNILNEKFQASYRDDMNLISSLLQVDMEIKHNSSKDANQSVDMDLISSLLQVDREVRPNRKDEGMGGDLQDMYMIDRQMHS
jgi:hypothetical protein